VIVFEGEESRNGISPNLIVPDKETSLLADRLELEGNPPRPICQSALSPPFAGKREPDAG
jgi:hypothetical protein